MAFDPAGSAFYPSVVVNLRVRFDESLHVGDVGLPGAVTVGDPLVTYRRDFSPNDLAGDRPLALAAPEDSLSWIRNLLPKEATVELSGYRQAGKWSLGFEYRDFPLDPRTIRAVGAEIHIGAVPAGDFGDGMVRTKPGGGRRSVLETRVNGVMREDTLIMVGTADLIHSEWGKDGATVRMEGRDLRGIFLDSPARPDLLAQLDLTKGIDDVVRQILQLHAFGGGIVVVTNPDDWENGVVPAPGDGENLTRVNMGLAGAAPGMVPQGDPHRLSVWDIVLNYCQILGAVPYFVGQRLVIRPARSLYDRRKLVGVDPSEPTPFAGGRPREVRTSGGTEQLKIRRLVYGRDVESLQFERKLGGIKVPIIELSSFNTSGKQRGRGKLLVVRYPDLAMQVPASNEVAGVDPSGAQLTSISPSGGQADRQVIRINYPGISSEKALRRIAQDLHQEIGRQELGGKVQTKRLSSFGGTNADPDLLHLRTGDPFEIVIDHRAITVQPPLANAVTDAAARTPFDQLVREMTARNGDENLSRVLVATARGQVQELQSFFRVSNVRYNFQAETGIDIAFDFQNYIEVRYDVMKQQENRAPAHKLRAGGASSHTGRRR